MDRSTMDRSFLVTEMDQRQSKMSAHIHAFLLYYLLLILSRPASCCIINPPLHFEVEPCTIITTNPIMSSSSLRTAREGMEGYLLKKNRFGLWSWRWFVLDRKVHPPTLSIYMKRSSSNKKPKATMQITASTPRVVLLNQTSSNRHFSICSGPTDTKDGQQQPQQKWNLCAGSEESLQVWKDKLDATIAAVKEYDMLSRVEIVESPRRHDPFGIGSLGGGKYQAIKQVGKGSYGSVISAYDKDRQTKVAVKKVHDIFDDLVDAKRVVREIRALRSLNHDNIIRLVDLPMPPPPRNFRDVYIVTELMEQDLYTVIYHHQKLSLHHIQFILYQILCALKYIHSAGVIHRDLKPQNILISSDCKVKLCDFGLSRCLNSRGGDTRDKTLTQYIVTRWYRAPEILLGCQTYTEAVDMWGLGCILGEMLQQRPLFPGSNFASQVRRIIDFVGRPEEEERLEFITNARAKKFVTSMAVPTSKIEADTFFPEADESIRYLLRRLLTFNPSERVTVDMALSHEFFASIRDATSEKVSNRKLIWDKIDDVELTKSNLQVLVYNEVGAFMRGKQERQMRRNSY